MLFASSANKVTGTRRTAHVMRRVSTFASRLWDATQIKRRGRYPVRRLLALREFVMETPRWQVVSALVLAPLPSLLAITLANAVSLSPPHTGLEHNGSFYVRAFATYYLFCVLLLQQFCMQVGPALPLSRTRLAGIALVVAVVNISFTYLLASSIGFPVPFTMQVCVPTHLLLETLALFVSWRRQLRANPKATGDIIRACGFFLCQAFMIVIYPVYYYGFTLVPGGSAQHLAYFCLLPVLKLLDRHLLQRFARKTGDGGEHVPLFVVLNADVMGSLFVAFCVQYKPSLVVVAGLALMKVLLAVMSILDLRSAAVKLAEVRGRAKNGRASRQSPHDLLDVVGGSGSPAPAKSVLDEEAEILARYGMDASSTVRWRALSHSADRPDCPMSLSRSSIAWIHATRVSPVPSKGVKLLVWTSPATLNPAQCAQRREGTEFERRELRFAEFVLKLLYMAEFMVLVEYVEVIIPFVYSKPCSWVSGAPVRRMNVRLR